MQGPGAGASDPYGRIGVRPFINCCATRTVHGGSLMLPEVKAAMEAASTGFVNINELMEAAGARIAALTGAPWGMVTCGSAAAIATATAAAMAGNDPVLMLRLPDTRGMRADVVMPASHRFPYDQAIRMTGARIHGIAGPQDIAALDPGRVAMVALVGQKELARELAGGPDSQAMAPLVAWARANGIPVLVDAASEHPVRPDPWLARGADLVVYSGGKVLRGPQTSGLLIGREDLVRAAFANSAPHRAFCRPMKVGKEDVIGLLTALECWFARDTAAQQRRWQQDLDVIAAALDGVRGCTAGFLPPEPGDEQPQLALAIDPTLTGIDALTLRARLLDGTPRIMLDDVSARSGTLVIEPFSLQPGEAAQVGAAIAAVLAAAGNGPVPSDTVPSGPALTGPAAPLAGDWELEIAMSPRPRRFTLRIGPDAAGSFTSADALGGGLTHGRISAATGPAGVTLALEAVYEAAIMTWQLPGMFHGPDRLEGTAMIGSTTEGTRGEVSYSQYGSARWTARRIG